MARKGENIYKRKDGRWEGRYIKGRDRLGKALYGYVYSKTYRDVKNKLVVTKSTLNNAGTLTSKTFLEVSALWLESVLSYCKKSTYAKYKNTLEKHILPVFGQCDIAKISVPCINEFCQNKLLVWHLSPKSVKDMLSIIKQVIRYAANFGITNNQDFKEIVIASKKHNIKGMTNTQVKLLSEFLLTEISYINVGILFSLYTGVRIGEICALKIGDISFDDKVVHIDKTMQRIQNFSDTENKTDIIISSPKSECSIRDIPIPQFIIDIIVKLNYADQNAYLLTGTRNKYIEPRTLENNFKKIARCCGVKDVTFHMIRHSFATMCIEAGVDIKSLSEILGHSSVNITLNRYVHTDMRTKQINMEKLYSYSVLSPSKK